MHQGTAAALEPWYVIIYQIKDVSLIGALDKVSLTSNWDFLPHGNATQEFGRLWLTDRTFPFLKVPSARLHISFYPDEHNLLLNPMYPGIQDLFKVVDTRRFENRIGGGVVRIKAFALPKPKNRCEYPISRFFHLFGCLYIPKPWFYFFLQGIAGQTPITNNQPKVTFNKPFLPLPRSWYSAKKKHGKFR